ncbi:hypothetical protein Enr13x_60000 [Stieleria neptunia]|uniref:Uncharacterized protein n=1 Tax=Stieleria neptunia TaxID=2527979 RepID=A0A518HZ20_9BACT|nr:hypothetical protein [Stieleria neptunia]QDV46096.1 hypothetical protein Enr13x_60000 [Stieleria neptunia]
MSRFDRCAVDEDKPTPVDSSRSTSTAVLSTSTIQDKPTPEVPTVDWDAEFPFAIPIGYIGRERRWLKLSSRPTARTKWCTAVGELSLF